MGTWEELDHTADLAIRVCANSLEDLFSTAAEAMFSLTAQAVDTEPISIDDLELEGIDRETLLIEWLNELLYIHERDDVVIMDIEFKCLTNTALQASVRGVPVEEYYAHIKAATFHNLRIDTNKEGFCTAIVFDV